LDHICGSTGFVGVGIDDRVHVGRRYSCPAGHRHYCDPDPGASRTKTGVTRWTFATQGELFEIKELLPWKRDVDLL
jgi:hypothetical protein